MGDKFVGVLGIRKCIAQLLSGSVTCGSEILAMFEEARTNFYFLQITELLFLLTLLYFSHFRQLLLPFCFWQHLRHRCFVATMLRFVVS